MPTIRVKLDDEKLVKIEDLQVEWVNEKSKTGLWLLLIHYNCIFSRNIVIGSNILVRSVDSENILGDMIGIIQMLYVFLY